MDKDKVLDEIFSNDPLGLLEVRAAYNARRTPDERLLASFEEINGFVDANGRKPSPNAANVGEYQLYSRLKSIQDDPEKVEMLWDSDRHFLLDKADENVLHEPEQVYKAGRPKGEIKSLDDILSDDSLDILSKDDEGLFDFKHTPKDFERASADFVARRRPCRDFDKYEEAFRQVQKDLKEGKRRLIAFKQETLRPGDYYVHNGVLLFLESVEFEKEVQEYNSGRRARVDGRTRTIFENGTESRMLYRSLYKVILANGQSVTRNSGEVNEKFTETFNSVSDEDVESGYIYVLRSKSSDKRLSSIKNLHKIGFSRTEIPERLKNAEREPTYLMSNVEYVVGWKCFNMNPQKFEHLVHTFFGSSCLEIDVFDENGSRHTPREWFIVPFGVIEQAVELIISGKITQYRYDPVNSTIVHR